MNLFFLDFHCPAWVSSPLLTLSGIQLTHTAAGLLRLHRTRSYVGFPGSVNEVSMPHGVVIWGALVASQQNR